MLGAGDQRNGQLTSIELVGNLSLKISRSTVRKLAWKRCWRVRHVKIGSRLADKQLSDFVEPLSHPGIQLSRESSSMPFDA